MHPDLPTIIKDLTQSYEHLGFLRSQELEAKAAVYLSFTSESVQYRDRQATYQSAHITTEILQLEAHIQALNVQRQYLEQYGPPDGSLD